MSIDSSMSTPDVIDEVGVSLITTDGNVFYSNTVVLKAGGVLPPMDLGVAPSDGPIRAVAVGFRKGSPKVFREAVASSPDTALQLLQVGLDWENWGSASLESLPGSTTTSEGVHLLAGEQQQGRTRLSFGGRWVRSMCGAGMTALGGTCQSATEKNLPEYSENLEKGGPGRRCFGVDACMAGGYEVVMPAAVGKVCKVQLSGDVAKWVGDGAKLNVAADVELDAGVTFLAPTNKSPAVERLDGWKLSAGVLELPLTFCTPDPAWQMPEVGKETDPTKTYDWKWTPPKRVLLSTRCAAKTRQTPVCQKDSKLKPVDVSPDQGAMPVVVKANMLLTRAVSADPVHDTILGVDMASTSEGVGVAISKLHDTVNDGIDASGESFLLSPNGTALEALDSVLGLGRMTNNNDVYPMPTRIAGAGKYLLHYAPGMTDPAVERIDASLATKVAQPYVISPSTVPDIRYLRHAALESDGTAVLMVRAFLPSGAAPYHFIAPYVIDGQGVGRSDGARQTSFADTTPQLAVPVGASAADMGYATYTALFPGDGKPVRTPPPGGRIVSASASADKTWVDVLTVNNEKLASRSFQLFSYQLGSTVDTAIAAPLLGLSLGRVPAEIDIDLNPAPSLFGSIGNTLYFFEAATPRRLVAAARDGSMTKFYELRDLKSDPPVAMTAMQVGAERRVYFAALDAPKKNLSLSYLTVPQ